MNWIEIIIVAGLIVGFAILMTAIERNYRYNEDLAKNKSNSTIGSIEYSENVLNFIKTITNSIAVLKFRSFEDNHNMDKITQEIFKKLVIEVAAEVHESIDSSKIDFDKTLFTEKFYESYIVDMSVFAIKSLLNDFMNRH